MNCEASVVFSTAYFPPPSLLPLGLDGDVRLEAMEHYSKGSCRNRCYLAGPQGAMILSVPLERGKNQQCPIRDVRIDTSSDWQRQHWKSIRSAYGKSPFFIHYADALEPLFQQRFRFLFDWNEACTKKLLQLMGRGITSYLYTEQYQKNLPETWIDAREQRGKARLSLSLRYAQVFEERTGFLPDLSTLDLLFCTGPEAASHLRNAWAQISTETTTA
jgi:hypothetical protein